MPEIFEENCKFKIVEYGKQESVLDIMSDMKDGILSLISK